MEYKHLIIFICIFSSFALISAVSAADLDVCPVKDNNSIGSFTDLANKINESNGTVNLDKDYIYDSNMDGQYKEGINISKEIIIEGNGFSVNGNNAVKVFNVNSQNVMLKDVTFLNSRAYFGGVVNWNGSNGSIVGCNFINNTVSSYGIVQWYGDNGRVINSNFINNNVSGYGAVYWSGDGGNIFNCSFINNGDLSRANESAHIVLDYVPNCYEVNPYSLPAIRNMYFYKGGAVYWRGDDGSIDYCNFVNNSAYEGGAVYWYGCNASITNCSFSSNNAVTDSDNMYFHNNSRISRISNILFLNNSRFVLGSYGLFMDYFSKYENILIIENESITYYFSNSSNVTFDKLEDLKDNNQISPYFKMILFGLKKDSSKEAISRIAGAKDIVKYYKSPVYYTVRVYDGDSFATGKLVKLTINKKTYPLKVDGNGYVTLKLNQKPGRYVIHVEYGKVKVKNMITVKSTLITKNLSKKVKKSAKFNVKVLNSKGKVFAKQVVKITFKGKIYKIKTNSKGLASFDIPENLKVGKHTIKTTCNGLTNTNKIIVKK